MTALLVPRDLQIGYALGTFAPATAEDIQRLLFPGGGAERARRTTARRRLGKLCALGLVRQLRTDNLADPAYYALTTRGLEWVAEESGVDAETLRTRSGLGRMNLAAHRAMNRLRVSFVLAARAHPWLRLAAFHPERELRVRSAAGGLPLVPDALVVLGPEDEDGEDAIAVALELDLGTERHLVLREKIRAYAALGDGPLFGFGRWLLAFSVPTRGRAETILRLAAEEGASAFTLVGVAADLDEQGVLADAWRGGPEGGARTLAGQAGYLPRPAAASVAAADGADSEVVSDD